jgi:hypothetical protein
LKISCSQKKHRSPQTYLLTQTTAIFGCLTPIARLQFAIFSGLATVRTLGGVDICHDLVEAITFGLVKINKVSCNCNAVKSVLLDGQGVKISLGSALSMRLSRARERRTIYLSTAAYLSA